MRKAYLIGGLLFLIFGGIGDAVAQSPGRSWYKLTTGNGHGFQVFSRIDGKLEQFLEHPYRFVAPPGGPDANFEENRDGGIGRRDLMHDAYFGIRVGGQSRWLNVLRTVEYEDQSHIILARESESGLRFSIRYFAPFGFESNALIMTISVDNTTDESVEVSVMGKLNLKLGRGRPEPGSENEEITVQDGRMVETGPGGGHAFYFPVGTNTSRHCGADAALFDAWSNNQALPSAER